MNLPLSVLLPVRNVQTTLHPIVHKLLEILPELTQQFEVLIIDDGSTDATCEVAYELARAYPQIQVTRNAIAQGWATAVTRQALQARGEFIMIHGGGSLESDDLVGLWRLRQGVAAAAIAKARAAEAGKSYRIDLHSFGEIKPHDDSKSSPSKSSTALGNPRSRAAFQFASGASPSAWPAQAIAGADAQFRLARRPQEHAPPQPRRPEAADISQPAERIHARRVRSTRPPRVPIPA